jgi:hypothetical protein
LRGLTARTFKAARRARRTQENPMPNHVCHGAQLMCSMGMAPSNLAVLPINMVNTSNVPAANIMDHIPMLNIMPFGMCQSPSNPQVIAATAAAMGVLTPMPCIPVTPAPWISGSPTVMLAHQPALNKSSKLMCIWQGQITIMVEGQMTHAIP